MYSDARLGNRVALLAPYVQRLKKCHVKAPMQAPLDVYRHTRSPSLLSSGLEFKHSAQPPSLMTSILDSATRNV